MEKELILEIGTEEIPARFLGEAIRNLGLIAEQELKNASLSYNTIHTYGTPRRLTLRVTGLLEKQKDRIVEILGPPKRIAFDENGVPTKAALGFAKSQGVNVEDLVIVEREKGELVAVRKIIRGKKTKELLKKLIPQIVLSIPFKKSMRWGNVDISFVRPIRWILAVYDGKTIPFVIGDVKSGATTRGHRFMSAKPFRIRTWEEYIDTLGKNFVVLDQDRRKETIKKEINKLAENINGKVQEDEELLDTVTHLVEFPVVLMGSFSIEFLQLPKEVLISVMRNHQKYFPVFSATTNPQGYELLPYFIFVCGTPVKDPQIVISGNEKVIRARFTDAKFFFEEDTKTPLSKKIEKLKDMVFLSDLGTYYDKTQRLEKLVTYIGRTLGLQENQLKELERAAVLSKADLATQMVFEFPELQGIMGKYYALISGETDLVAKAIEEQYMPTSREGKLPETLAGAILSISDKIDNISACFILGLTPTGTSDPYALRRQAIALINIVLSKELNLELKKVFRHSLELITSQFKNNELREKVDETLKSIMDFIAERLKNLLVSEGFSQDVVDAVVATGCSNIVESKKKIEALEEFRRLPEFNPLAIAFKRVVNIVKGQPRDKVEETLLVESTEHLLYQAFLEAKKSIDEKISEGRYKEALIQMKALKEPIDRYFDEVLVMDKDSRIRKNRLSMLWEIRDLFFKIADFSKINTP
ncbi:MAG: glycine--tRNA ligase beta subunit [Deltaproteobacteria bacterium]|nr:MAG: glycine--tRNA ligase beta subunit [Deltaproteobacteria bacterium]